MQQRRVVAAAELQAGLVIGFPRDFDISLAYRLPAVRRESARRIPTPGKYLRVAVSDGREVHCCSHRSVLRIMARHRQRSFLMQSSISRGAREGA